MITYDDFAKMDIRIGTILSAEPVPETRKLLRLMIDLQEGEPRQLVAGIAEYVADPATLVGVQIPVLANLEPRTIRGIESRGMILAASAETPDGRRLSLLHPASPLPPGSQVG